MSINYIIIIVYGNINMIAKYMPNLKKVSEFEDKSIFKYSYAMNDYFLIAENEMRALELCFWTF
jgi:hypothetical protein